MHLSQMQWIKKKKLIKEFYGCYFHGCPKCYPEHQEKYNKTQERESLLKLAGKNVNSIWESKWNEIKETLSNKNEIEETAKKTKH